MRLGLSTIAVLILCVSHAAAGPAAEILDRADVHGGIVVHLGCGDGSLLADMAGHDGYIVHGLDRDPAKVAHARERLLSKGLYGKVSVDVCDGKRLPYAENIVNLLVVDSSRTRIDREEILRVLVPNGVALIDGKKKLVKPVPSDIDEWSHFEHGPENNSVAADTVVGPPRHLQWTAGPRWLRSHEIPSGISSMVTAGGRVFYTLDEGPVGITDTRLPEKWVLIARDAFNGTQLWKMDVPNWGWQTWGTDYKDKYKGIEWIRSGGLRGKNPDSYLTRIVADSDRLYFTLGYAAPVSIIDAATGKVTAICEGSEKPDKLLLSNGVLCVKLSKGLVAYDSRTGKPLWKKESVDAESVAAHGNVLVYHTGEDELLSVDLKTGRSIWTSKIEEPGKLTIGSDKILSASDSAMQVLSMDSGHTIWRKSDKDDIPELPKRGSHYIIGDTIWVGYRGDRLDLETGEKLPSLGVTNLWSPQHHHRCYPNKATSRYIIGAMEGMEYLALEDDSSSRNNWVRGACSLGIMPANGMTYALPDQCFCSPGVKILGMNALTATRDFGEVEPAEQRLVKGPHYGKSASNYEKPLWAAYRHDALRSGSNAVEVPADLQTAWSVHLDPSITQPAVAGTRLFVASRDTHTVHAINTESGKQIWRFTAGGRVDTSPTLWKSYLLFGSADGHVYCLRQSDGDLVWKFRAAPHTRMIQSFGQLESAWPLHGSVLILDDLAYVAAGRSTYLDGGLYMYALEPETGKVVYQHQELGPYEDHSIDFGHSFWSEGARNDVLVSDGDSIYIMQLRFDKKLNPNPAETESLLGDRKLGRHIFSTAGFLDDGWYNRTFWMYSNIWPGFYLANQASKSGQLLVFDEDTTYGIKTFWTRNRHSPMFFPETKGYILVADDNDAEPILVGRDKGDPVTWLPEFNMHKGGKPKTDWGPELSSAPRKSAVDAYTYNKDKGIGFTRAQKPRWTAPVPIRVKAMVNTKDKLFVAGAPDILDESNDPLGALEGRKGGLLRAVSTADGSKLGEYNLDASPVLDGLIAVEGKLYLVTRDGKLSCWK